jgi:secreted trypsin-like serine protease
MHRTTRPKSLIATLAATIALLTVMVMPASAITKGGVVDTAEDFPHVGLMVAYDLDDQGNIIGAWRCTGTLVSPTMYVTAGHCTSGADTVNIWFDYDLTDAAEHNYPFGPADVSGTPYTHPQYDDATFFMHDLGVVILDTPWDTGGVYADLPTLNQLDSLKPGKRTTFTTVGYGLQRSFPPDTPADAMLTEDDRLRMVARPHLLQINNANVGDFAMLISNNSSTGGTCFGDSGGPTFIGNTIVAVTSYGLTYTCAGVGGVYRLDTADDLDWLYNNPAFTGHLPA